MSLRDLIEIFRQQPLRCPVCNSTDVTNTHTLTVNPPIAVYKCGECSLEFRRGDREARR